MYFYCRFDPLTQQVTVVHVPVSPPATLYPQDGSTQEQAICIQDDEEEEEEGAKEESEDEEEGAEEESEEESEEDLGTVTVMVENFEPGEM